jgi:periplasmic protein TonB
MSRRLAVWLLVSLAIHAGLASVAPTALRAAMPPMLFIDLVHGLLAGDESAASARPVGRDSAPSAVLRGAAPVRRALVPDERPQARATPALPAPLPDAPREVAVREAPPQAAPEPAGTVPEPTREMSTRAVEAERASPPAAHAGAMAPGVGEVASTSPAPAGVQGPSRGEREASAGTPGASRGGASAGGGPTTGLGVSDPLTLAVPGQGGGDAAEYAEYLAFLRRRVVESLTYPAVARRRGLTGTVQVDLDIHPTGVISRVEVVTSSSHRVLDDAAVEAVRGLGRVPFPSNVQPRLLRVRLPVVFDLR